MMHAFLLLLYILYIFFISYTYLIYVSYIFMFKFLFILIAGQVEETSKRQVGQRWLDGRLSRCLFSSHLPASLPLFPFLPISRAGRRGPQTPLVHLAHPRSQVRPNGHAKIVQYPLPRSSLTSPSSPPSSPPSPLSPPLPSPLPSLSIISLLLVRHQLLRTVREDH